MLNEDTVGMAHHCAPAEGDSTIPKTSLSETDSGAGKVGFTPSPQEKALAQIAESVGGDYLGERDIDILGPAASRPDHLVLPLTNSYGLDVPAQNRFLMKLLRLELIERIPAEPHQPFWVTNIENVRITLRLSLPGEILMGVAPLARPTEEGNQ